MKKLLTNGAYIGHNLDTAIAISHPISKSQRFSLDICHVGYKYKLFQEITHEFEVLLVASHNQKLNDRHTFTMRFLLGIIFTNFDALFRNVRTLFLWVKK